MQCDFYSIIHDIIVYIYSNTGLSKQSVPTCTYIHDSGSAELVYALYVYIPWVFLLAMRRTVQQLTVCFEAYVKLPTTVGDVWNA